MSLDTLRDASTLPFSSSASTVWLSGCGSRPIVIMLTSYDQAGTAYACLNGLCQRTGTLISGGAPCLLMVECANQLMARETRLTEPGQHPPLLYRRNRYSHASIICSRSHECQAPTHSARQILGNVVGQERRVVREGAGKQWGGTRYTEVNVATSYSLRLYSL